MRRVARDLGVDLTTIVGTGPGGLITHEDVIAAASGAKLDDRPGVDQRSRCVVSAARCSRP